MDLHLIDDNWLLVVCEDILKLLHADVGDSNVLHQLVVNTSLKCLPCALQQNILFKPLRVVVKDFALCIWLFKAVYGSSNPPFSVLMS